MYLVNNQFHGGQFFEEQDQNPLKLKCIIKAFGTESINKNKNLTKQILIEIEL